MTRIAESKPNPHVSEALEQFEKLGFEKDLLSATDLTAKRIRTVGPEHVVDVLVELSKHDAIVRRRLGNLKNVYPKHEEFVEKICQLDAAGLADALKKLSFCAQSKVYLFWKNKTPIAN